MPRKNPPPAKYRTNLSKAMGEFKKTSQEFQHTLHDSYAFPTTASGTDYPPERHAHDISIEISSFLDEQVTHMAKPFFTPQEVNAFATVLIALDNFTHKGT